MASTPVIEVALRLTGQGFDPADITVIVQLAPTKTWRLGESVQKSLIQRKDDGWCLGLPQRESFDLEGFLRELLDLIEPHKSKVGEAVKQFGLQTVISFAGYVRGQTPAIWFAPNTLRRIVALEASLDIDLILTK